MTESPDPIDEFLDDMEGGSDYSQSPQRSESNAVTALEDRAEINLAWRGINVEVGPDRKRIINQCSGHVSAGEMVAIMGPSGSGKTSLLNMLNGRYQKKDWSGELYVNGREFDPEQWGDRAAFVQQANYLLGFQTVREVLVFAAKMRLFGTEDDINAIVNRQLHELGLEECADVFCGDAEVKGISGGQAKRVCIGRDLVTNPNFIMLDEPTSGLDSYTAVKVIEILRRLASKGRSVMMTIHQPSQAITRMFDRFIFMDGGEVFVQGTLDQIREKLSAQGHPCPADTPVSEFVFELIAQLSEAELRTWKDDARFEGLLLPLNTAGEDLGAYKRIQTPCNFLYQLWLHIEREGKLQFRNLAIIGLEFGLAIFLFLVAFFCYYYRSKSDNDSDEYPVSAYQFAVYLGYATVPISKNAFSSTKFVYRVEYSCGTYTMVSYYSCKLLFILWKLAIVLLIIVPMVFFGFNFDGNVIVVYVYSYVAMLNLALMASFFVILVDSNLGATVINLLIITSFDMLCMTKPNQIVSETFVASLKYFAWSRLFFCLVVNETSPPEVVEKHVQDALDTIPLLAICFVHIVLWGSLVPYMLRVKGKLMY